MVEAATLEREFKRKVRTELDLVSEGMNRYLVSTPFTFGDGDGLPIVLKREGSEWILTDEGHTLMQLTYEFDESDLRSGERKGIIDQILASLQVENRQGELVLPIPGKQYGDALYSFVQALLRIDDIRLLSLERVRTTFMDDFRNFIDQTVPEQRRAFGWHHPQRDPAGNYIVDCKINGDNKPALLLFALNTNARVHFATISLYEIEKWDFAFHSVGILEDLGKISQRTLAVFMNICNKTYADLAGAQERLAREYPDITSAPNG